MSDTNQPIKSIPEALKILGSVKSDTERLGEFFGRFSVFLTGGNGGDETPPYPYAVAETPPKGVKAKIPDTLADRVLQIVSEAATAITPREILTAYGAKGNWPVQDYNGITGSLSYLTNKKNLLTKTDGKYSLAPKKEELSAPK